jgi:ribosomal protein S18 acetylase RimI-like enzyme
LTGNKEWKTGNNDMTYQEITILPFQVENQADAKNLILMGMAEHWGAVDPSKNPDLANISLSYANAVFLVAWHAGRLVGTGALVPKSDQIAEVVRMSVAADMRRTGIGSRILHELCEHARSRGIRCIVLETTDTWQDAIEFYKRFGFHITHHLNGDVYFALDLR